MKTKANLFLLIGVFIYIVMSILSRILNDKIPDIIYVIVTFIALILILISIFMKEKKDNNKKQKSK